MRIPAPPRTGSRGQPSRGPRATQPSTPAATMRSTGPQGTPGGKARKVGAKASKKLGQEVYLWILVLIEVMLTGGLRKYFRRYHGG